MLHIFLGEDIYRKKQRMNGIVENLSKEGRFFLFSRFNSEDFKKEEFEESARGGNLFGGNRVIACEDVLSNKDIAEFILANINACVISQSIFIFLENSLDVKTAKVLKDRGAIVEEFPCLSSSEAKNWLKDAAKKIGATLPHDIEKKLLEESKQDLWLLSSKLEQYHFGQKANIIPEKQFEQINIFKITDAILEKNKSHAWLLFQKMLLVGLDAEEIFWKILWQIKNLLIVKKLLSASPAGGPLEMAKIAQKANLHPYVAKKTIYAAKNFSNEGLARYSAELIKLYHDSRRGLADFETGVEKFLIRL